MPTSGPVYQPTTVTYEQQPNESSWTRPVSYLSQTVSNRRYLHKPMVQIAILVMGLLTVLIGLVMVVNGSINYADTRQYPTEVGDKDPIYDPGDTAYLAIAISGVVVIMLGIAIIIFYIRVVGCRRTCPCVPSKEARLARQLQGNGAAQVLALNPSTDLLVSAQYAPVSEVPAQIDEEQRRKLMAADNKDCLSSAEESDRMLEADPRIVLRPHHMEEA